MTSLFEPTANRKVTQRIDRLTPRHAPRWGRMSVGEMVCHLNDYFDVALGRVAARPIGNTITQALGRWIAIYLPLPWPRNIRTLPEFKATNPADFERDRSALRANVHAFAERKDRTDWPFNPAFGKLSDNQWAVLAYRHLDHHLKQFGE